AQRVAQSAGSRLETGTRWVVDPVHSQVDFHVRHLVGRVRGTFTNWYALLVTQGHDWSGGAVKVTVQSASLNTGNRYRDADLRSDHFFDVERFPQITFQSTGITASDSTLELGGILTMKGASRPVVLRGRYGGVMTDRDGRERIAFEATTTVDRRDFGITWNEVVGGVPAIGNDVEITIAVEAVRVN
ncbi:MAG TPA: YceI family protein, partial [Gemmatimonadales bacterium]|nr:YceI family protein [Gemmatimonadales bacterium]